MSCLFDSTGVQLLSISQFMEKSEFQKKAVKAAKGRIEVEKEKNRKSETDVIASAVMGEVFDPYVKQERAYICYVCAELLEHPTFKSGLVVVLACFDYSVLFLLPKGASHGLLFPVVPELRDCG